MCVGGAGGGGFKKPSTTNSKTVVSAYVNYRFLVPPYGQTLTPSQKYLLANDVKTFLSVFLTDKTSLYYFFSDLYGLPCQSSRNSVNIMTKSGQDGGSYLSSVRQSLDSQSDEDESSTPKLLVSSTQCNESINTTQHNDNVEDDVLTTYKGRDSKEMPYHCTTCGKGFNYQCMLTRHQLIHSGEKPYECKACGKAFSHKWNLTRHQRIHSGEKPYMCSTCAKSFARQGGLTRHQRIHSGEKPFMCKKCEKSFSQKGQLIRHQSIHSGVKLYTCKVCGKSFAQQCDLTRHQRMHRGEKA